MPDDRELSDLLQAIRNEGVEVAADALFHLQMRICPQGVAVSRETAAALPTLIDIVADEGSRVRYELLRLVVKISRASHAWRNSARHAQPEYFENYVEKIDWEAAVDRAFSKAVPIFVRLASDAEPGIASMARDLIERHQGN